MRVKSTNNCIGKSHGDGMDMVPPTDVQIVTSDGNTIAAHSSVLVIEQLRIDDYYRLIVDL